MRLVAQATLADESSWPTEIRSVSLHDSDITMTDSEKMRKGTAVGLQRPISKYAR